VNKITKKPVLQPKTCEELEGLVSAEIEKNGYECDLSHIDVSLVTNFSRLFMDSKFNGDISRWDVSSATSMDAMFAGSEFNGDLSKWDVSAVKSMHSMFDHSKFNGDISSWDTSSVKGMSLAFYGSEFYGDISGWDTSSLIESGDMFFDSGIAKKLGIENPSFEQVKSHFLSLKLETCLEKPPEQGGPPKVRL